jgi:hypothetical protein
MKALDKLNEVDTFEFTDVIATEGNHLGDLACGRFLSQFCLSPIDNTNCVAKLLNGLCEGNYIDDSVMLDILSYAVYNNYPLNLRQVNKLICKPSLNNEQVVFLFEELLIHPRFFDQDLSNMIGAADMVKYEDALYVHLNNNVNEVFLNHCLLHTGYHLAQKLNTDQRVGLIERLLIDSEGGRESNKGVDELVIAAYHRLDDFYKDEVCENIDWVKI